MRNYVVIMLHQHCIMRNDENDDSHILLCKKNILVIEIIPE